MTWLNKLFVCTQCQQYYALTILLVTLDTQFSISCSLYGKPKSINLQFIIAYIPRQFLNSHELMQH
jgi:hypothetical protein